MTGPGYGQAPLAAGRGHLRASHADREQMIDMLKAAFVQGRLTKDEFDARVGQTLASRTYAELATVTAGLPARRPEARPSATPPRPRMSNAARWATSGVITPAVLAVAFTLGSLPGGSGSAVVAYVIAFAYFVLWLSTGADMLWQWYSMGVPTARMCVRCAHTAASHRGPASCSAHRGSPKLWRRCACAGYVPPGRSLRTADLRLLSTHCR